MNVVLFVLLMIAAAVLIPATIYAVMTFPHG